MTMRDARRKNNMAFLFVGAGCALLGAFHLHSDDLRTGVLFFAAAAAFCLPIFFRNAGEKKERVKFPPPRHMGGKNG